VRNDDLATELQYFEDHRLEWLERSPNKFALVKGPQLVDVFDDENEAVRAGYRRFGNTAFLVKRIAQADVPLLFSTFNLGI
jgi:hypothetical protein